jgi:MOSC domain-containing protein YiiM
MLDGTFIKRFRQAELPGAYTRVIEEGAVSAGDPVALEPAAQRDFTLIDMFRLFYDHDAPIERYRRGLEAPIAQRARATYERAVEEG